jgi:hypothetical protein
MSSPYVSKLNTTIARKAAVLETIAVVNPAALNRVTL